VLVPGRKAARVLVAGAHGAASAAMVTGALRGAARASGRRPVVRDVVPLPRHDALGLSPFFTVFATAIPSLVFGAVLTLLGGGFPARVRWAAVAAFAGLAGLVAALAVDTVAGALTGDFWGLAGVAALLALAVAALSSSLVRLLGWPGVGLAALVVVLLGQSSAGGAVGYQFLPGFYRAVSQLLPSGAALTALRDTVYFGGAHTATPLLVLAAWVAAGICVGLVAERRRIPERRTP